MRSILLSYYLFWYNASFGIDQVLAINGCVAPVSFGGYVLAHTQTLPTQDFLRGGIPVVAREACLLGADRSLVL